MKIYKGLSYATLTLGLVGVVYGFSEYIYALKSVQFILGNIIESNHQFTDPTFQAIINIAIGQATSMKVLAYIAPGFILSALGIIMLFLSDILAHLNGIGKVVYEVIQGVNDVFTTDDNDVIELTEEVKKEK